MKTKICTKCNKELNATTENFNKMKKGKYGLRSMCKACSKIYRKQYTSTDEYKKKHRESMYKWRRENPKEALDISRRSYKKNGHKQNIKRKEKYKTDPVFKEKAKERERKYKESGRRHEVQSTPDQMEKSRLRSAKRRLDPAKKKQDYKRNEIYRKENKEKLKEMHTRRRNELCDSYVAQSMRVSVKHLSTEIIETKRLIIKLKRELKNN